MEATIADYKRLTFWFHANTQAPIVPTCLADITSLECDGTIAVM